MRDLFSGRVIVCMYMSVTLRNVTLQSVSECQFCSRPGAQASLYYMSALMEDGVGGVAFVDDGGLGGQRGLAFAVCVFGGVKCRNEC